MSVGRSMCSWLFCQQSPRDTLPGLVLVVSACEFAWARFWIIYLLWDLWILNMLSHSVDALLILDFYPILIWFATMGHWICVLSVRPQCSLQGVRAKAILLFVGVCVALSVVALTVIPVAMSRHVDWVFVEGNLLDQLRLLMVYATHVATALLFQADCTRATSAIMNLTRSAANYDRAVVLVRLLKRRWHTFLRLHFLLEGSALALLIIGAFFFSKQHLWFDVVLYCFGSASSLCLAMCQLYPLIEYNEAVARTRLMIDDYAMAQRLNREPFEFRVLQMVIDRGTFHGLVWAGVGSIMSVLVKKVTPM